MTYDKLVFLTAVIAAVALTKPSWKAIRTTVLFFIFMVYGLWRMFVIGDL